MGYKKLLSDTDNRTPSFFPSVQRYNAGMKQITEHIYCMIRILKRISRLYIIFAVPAFHYRLMPEIPKKTMNDS